MGARWGVQWGSKREQVIPAASRQVAIRMARLTPFRLIVAARNAALFLTVGGIGSACTPTESAILMGGATLVSFIHTDRTVSDHVIGAITDKDCSTLRMVNEGTSLCRDPAMADAQASSKTATAQMAAANSHCYRELGRVSCYDRPNPYSYRTNDDNTAQRR